MRKKAGAFPRWELFEHQDRMNERERLRSSPYMWRFRFALAWRDLGTQATNDFDALVRKYPTTCIACEGSVCPECPPDELERYARRNFAVFGTHDDPIELAIRASFASWLKREREARPADPVV